MARVLVDEEIDDLTGLVGAELVDCTLTGISAERAELDGMRLEGCRLVDCHLRLATIRDARFVDTAFLRCNLTGIDWTAADWPRFGLGSGLRFAGCALDLSTFAGLALPDLLLYACSARDVDFGGCDLSGADLQFSDLADARFDGADLRRAVLTGATGYDIPLEGTRLSELVVSLPDGAAFLRRLGLQVQPADDPLAPEAALDRSP
jgi:fluoroquinolone resistance protein